MLCWFFADSESRPDLDGSNLEEQVLFAEQFRWNSFHWFMKFWSKLLFCFNRRSLAEWNARGSLPLDSATQIYQSILPLHSISRSLSTTPVYHSIRRLWTVAKKLAIEGGVRCNRWIGVCGTSNIRREDSVSGDKVDWQMVIMQMNRNKKSNSTAERSPSESSNTNCQTPQTAERIVAKNERAPVNTLDPTLAV